MEKRSLAHKGPSNIVVALASMCAVATIAILNHYPGIIGIRFQVGSNSAHIVIDGRTSPQSSLPPHK